MRIIFWEEVTFFTITELFAFAAAVNQPSAKPAVIRRLFFRFSPYRDPDYSRSHEEMEVLTSKVLDSFPAIVRCLPAHLDVLHVGHCIYHDALYRNLWAVCQNKSWPVEVTKLVITSRPYTRDCVLKYFAFAHNIVHLELRVTCTDGTNVLDSSIPPMQLESLVLTMEFGGGTFYRCMAPAARAIKSALLRACSKLQSLTVILCGYDDSQKLIRIEAMTQVLSLGGPSMSALTLSARPEYGPDNIPIERELANAKAIPLYPNLLSLHLDRYGVVPDMFTLMGCSELRRLEITLAPTKVEVREGNYTLVAPDGMETMRNIQSCMELGELGNLEELVVNFGEYSVENRHGQRPRADTVEAWKPLEAVCAERNIAFDIWNPE
jgi:hypothetical protein